MPMQAQSLSFEDPGPEVPSPTASETSLRVDDPRVKRALHRIVGSEEGYIIESLSKVGTLQSEARSSGHDAVRQRLKQEIHRLLESAGTENWDSEGALALSPDTVKTAQRLVDTFPTYVDTPDVSATPHGRVSFDWFVDSDTMLIVSVGPSNDIAFAGSFQTMELNGSAPWNNELPPFVRCWFEQLRDLRTGT